MLGYPAAAGLTTPRSAPDSSRPLTARSDVPGPPRVTGPRSHDRSRSAAARPPRCLLSEPLRLKPTLDTGKESSIFAALVEALSAEQEHRLAVAQDRVTAALDSALSRARALPKDRQVVLEAALRVVGDLARQGWRLAAEEDAVTVSPPDRLTAVMEEKARVREQLHMGRDKQLERPSTRRFLRLMEQQRLHEGSWISIFSLMRDGRELAERLRPIAALPEADRVEPLRSVVQPYLQLVERDARCDHTGLLLQDIWRYFRHTWASAYRTTPGRNLNVLVRDAAAPGHPVVGIAALVSAASQIRIRDEWIGWTPDAVLAEVRDAPTDELARWLAGLWESSMAELAFDDLLQEGLVSAAELEAPTAETLERLRTLAADERERHRAPDPAPEPGDRAGAAPDEPEPEGATGRDGEQTDWIAASQTPLFRSKRAARLADLLEHGMALRAHLGAHTARALAGLAATEEGTRAIRYLARRAKADRMGVAIADIGVCGSVAPYNHLLGGKLVSMLMASPELGEMYDARYGGLPSIIASSMAARPICRGTDLVLLMTTSLYGAGSSQYNRLRVPCDRVGGRSGERVTYDRRGLTEGFGTSQFSAQTVECLGRVLETVPDAQRVQSRFGEGASPRLRKVREGLSALGLPSNELLKHGSPKVVYSIRLVDNLRRFLLGLDAAPDYRLSQAEPRRGTEAIGAWWTERWLSRRVERPDVLARVAAETLVYPVQHGARVVDEAGRAAAEEEDMQVDLFG